MENNNYQGPVSRKPTNAVPTQQQQNRRNSESPNVFDVVSAASSQRPQTRGEEVSRNRGRAATEGGSSLKVIKVKKSHNHQPNDYTNVANNFAYGSNQNDNSQLQHRPRVAANQSVQGQNQQQNSFKLSKEAYKKLTNHYNYSKVDTAKHKNQVAYATQDLRFQDSGLQQKFDRMSPGTITLKNQEQIRPNTGAGMMSTQNSSGMGMAYVGGGGHQALSVKRGSRNTLQAHMTMDSALTAGMTDPRFQMYNKEMIKSHLEKRRVRRAQSNIKPRKRFSTISAFHKNDVQVIHRHLQEEGITPTNNNSKQYNATALWSANVNLEGSNKKIRSYPIKGFNSGPAYSIPAQHYPGRLSPDKTDRDRTPRTPNAQRAASSRSPMRDIASQRTISPLPISDTGSITPGCTDYTPRHEQLLKQEPGYAPQRAARFHENKDKETFVNRPHVYEDPNKRTFRRSNSGTFTRAKRFSTPVDGQQVKAYLLTLKSRLSNGRQHSMGNLGMSSAKSNPKFTMTGGNVTKFDATQNLNMQESGKKARPSTEVGRMRNRRATEPMSTTDMSRDGPEQTTAISQSKGKQDGRSSYRIATSMHTPRFSVTQRNGGSTNSLDMSMMQLTPGPACYETRVNSCVKNSSKQMTFTSAPRWGVKNRPLVNPEAPLYDTRPSSWLLHRIQPRVRITEAKREISPHLFHAKNSTAFLKGVYLKP